MPLEKQFASFKPNSFVFSCQKLCFLYFVEPDLKFIFGYSSDISLTYPGFTSNFSHGNARTAVYPHFDFLMYLGVDGARSSTAFEVFSCTMITKIFFQFFLQQNCDLNFLIVSWTVLRETSETKFCVRNYF